MAVTDERVASELENLQKNNSNLTEADDVTEDAIIGGDIAELEGDTRKEDGILLENVSILPKFISNEEERQKFLSAGKGSVVVFNPYKAYDGNETELASLLKIDRDEVQGQQGKEFSFQIETIRVNTPAELNQDFFDQMFGEGKVTNEEEAKAKIREFIEKGESEASLARFENDFLDYVSENKASKLQVNEEVLVSLLSDQKKDNNEGEMSGEERDAFLKNFKGQLYMQHLAEVEGVKVTEEEIYEYALSSMHQQFMRYGWMTPDPELVKDLVFRQLKNEEGYS